MRATWVIPVAALVLLLDSSDVSAGQPGKSADQRSKYVPSVGEIMNKIDLSRSKLWYSVKLRNWPLAGYQLDQVKTGFDDVSRHHPDKSNFDFANAQKIANLIEEAIVARSDEQFQQSFALMTTECNDCHRAVGKPFLHVGAPKIASPYSDKMLEPGAFR
ncbi:hypothetical protein [Sinorhizobium meliloti]|uniref:hypothetical protein n=1 Tax=Rhizobium meliloti TaxID=382 RepID=UPI000375E9E3|nr:hypothetical protein [Sinorhizobium meliloti]MDE3876238.1 hypothetical protein [Sinorhizobium meliloti]MQV24503.1 hypothetical protein [Sinorhizobium meliloti]RVM04118.1 hypothetical protein CN125_28400 [Sinorhizobium meliloti]RVM41571.1 hypothetical protein CN121_29400 [Sinorhizobium meliloti]RVM57005.1 hypothetical protein CN124_30900 [Sinorhizobium meliloti]